MSALAEPRGADTPAASALDGLRVLVVHEWLYAWAGAERCLEQIFEVFPDAQLLAGIVTPEMRRQHPIAARATESWVGRLPGARTKHRWFLPLHAAAFAAYDTSRYDLVISVSHALEKAIRAPRGAHLCYCLTPPRFLYDMADAYASYASRLQRAALYVSTPALRAIDQRAARGVDSFVSISAFVADRVRRVYGRESTVVYPPVAPKRAHAPLQARESGRDPFLLTLGRLVPYKRVDLAIQAAERLGVRLLVAGDGPERDRLRRLAGPHTELLGAVSESAAASLLARCAAFVFCAEEDFGIAPVEANAHGAPVVAYARGGARETLTEGVTGVLFQEQTVDAVCDAIRRCLATSWDRRALAANAERFSPERFREGFRAAAARAVARV